MSGRRARQHRGNLDEILDSAGVSREAFREVQQAMAVVDPDLRRDYMRAIWDDAARLTEYVRSLDDEALDHLAGLLEDGPVPEVMCASQRNRDLCALVWPDDGGPDDLACAREVVYQEARARGWLE